jgi:hypothetical protein
VLTAALMLRRMVRALRYAVPEEEFLPVLSAGVALVVIRTPACALGADWSVIDALSFASRG